jgi:hypothetical protein
VFNVSGTTGEVEVQLPDGEYPDLLSETSVTVKEGEITLPESAVILRNGDARQLNPMFSELLDYKLPPH